MLSRSLKRHAREFKAYLLGHQYERTEDGGIFFPRAKATAHGAYWHSVNGGDVRIDRNLITTQGLNHMLDVTLGATAKVAGWYMALMGANATPLISWTAANYAANATELTSATEGYSGTVRPTFVPAAATDGTIDNFASRASFTMKTASSINVYGAAVLSNSSRGSTAGVLMSAAKYDAARTFNNNDNYLCGYQAELDNEA